MSNFRELRTCEVRRTPLLGRSCIRARRRAGVLSVPALLLVSVLDAHSFLALLLLFASQEVVRDPPYGVRGSAYRTRDPTYRIPYRIPHAAYRSRRGAGRQGVKVDLDLLAHL